MSPLLKGHTIMTKLTIRLTLACSLKHFPPSFVTPPSSTLTADDFATFFISKMTNLTAQFSTPQSVKHILPANINSFTYFSPLSEAEVSKLISGEGGVVQRGLQWERELGNERWVSWSSANDKHLCLFPVSGVERLHKRTGKGEAVREGQTADWRRWSCYALEFMLHASCVILSAGKATLCLWYWLKRQ